MFHIAFISYENLESGSVMHQYSDSKQQISLDQHGKCSTTMRLWIFFSDCYYI